MKHLIIYKSVPLGALGNVLEDSSSFSSLFSSLAVVEFVILKSPLFAESCMACIRLHDAFVLLVLTGTGTGQGNLLSTKHS